MKKFNKTITVQVSVDSIAEKLFAEVNESFAHRDMLVEAIIGSSNERQLGFIYNSLNGYSNEVNYTVGQQVICTDTVYDYSGQNEDLTPKEVRRPLDVVTVVGVDPYAERQLTVEYQYVKSNGQSETRQKEVYVSSCKDVPVMH